METSFLKKVEFCCSEDKKVQIITFGLYELVFTNIVLELQRFKKLTMKYTKEMVLSNV